MHDHAGGIVIAPKASQKWRWHLRALLALALLIYYTSKARAPWNVIVPALAASWFLLNAFGTWRERMRLDYQGIVIRNRFRTYRLGWPEISCMEDGESRYGNWELNVVFTDGGRVVPVKATNWATKVADPSVVAALCDAAGWYGTPAALTGSALKHRLPADPEGQRGVR